ncbi:MAG TPA: molybdenum cofactor guanylyltransferase [Roseivirga sp.]
MPNFNCVILSGGKSTRMGSDKALVEYEGKTLIQHALELTEELELDAYLSINANQLIWAKEFPHFIDEFESIGPMGGIYSSMKSLGSDLIVFPVDMPNLNREMLLELLNRAKLTPTITCYKLNGQLQPFPSYWPFEMLQSIDITIKAQQLSIKKFIEEHKPTLIPTTDTSLFKNLNHPSDLQS